MTEKLATTILETPIGKLRAVASDKGLCALEFMNIERQRLLDQRLHRWFDEPELVERTNTHINDTKRWLKKYFAGALDELPKLQLDLRGSEFETKVWKALQKVKCGQKLSYADLARRLGIPKAYRAVGNANRRNPLPLIVPCHRVVGSGGSLVGYAGGLPQKVWLITHESKFA